LTERASAGRPAPPGGLAYAVFLTLAVVDSSGFGVLAPVLPAVARSVDAGPGVAGLLVGAFAIGMGGGFLAGGVAVQRYGSARVLTGAMVLLALGAVPFVAAESLPAFFAGRVLSGVGSGAMWMGVALGVMERWPGAELRRLSGVLAMYSVGGIVGPALGAIGGLHAPFVAYLVVVVVAGALLAFVGAPAGATLEFSSDRSALRRPEFLLAFLGTIMASLTVGALDGVLPLHFDDRLTQAEIGGLYVGVSVVVALSAVAAGRLPVRPTLLAGTVLVVGGVAAAGATDAVWAWVLALALAAVGFGLADTSSLGTLLETSDVQRIVLALAVWSQGFALGLLLGPALGGLVAETIGYAAIGLVPGAFAVLLVAVLWRQRPARAPGTPASRA
jgi:MFS family permease